jgi:nucleotide-binding universal stress UspA family protein
MFKMIVVAVDGSAAGERILLFAEHLARVESAPVVVVHAYQLPVEYEWADSYAALAQQFEAVANEVAQDALEALSASGAKVTADVRQGNAAEVILAAAHTHQADLIIMGSRAQRRGAVAEALLGSVSSTVLRNSICPVLIVP